jgi:hypothetical protein
VFTNGINVLATDEYHFMVILQSSTHLEWARKYGSTLKNDLRYTPTKCFETFPFPDVANGFKVELDQIGKEYLLQRSKLMRLLELGITKLYNIIHARELKITDIMIESNKSEEICIKALNEILSLRQLHMNMDNLVLKSYGWEDIKLLHDFYEVEYLPEHDRVRYSTHPTSRKEVLKRLLELNHTKYEEEVKMGLHKEEEVRKFYDQKGMAVPEEVTAVMGQVKKEKKAGAKKKANEKSSSDPEIIRTQQKMFEEPNLFDSKEK